MISVLLPLRDASTTVGAALASVLVEPAVGEVIAVDDGSLDASAAIVAAMAARDPRVRLVRGPARGIVGALGVALGHARGDLLARMDADDISHPGRIAACAAMLARDESLGAVGTQVTGDGAGEGMAAYIAWQNALVTPDDHARELFVEAPLCHPSTVLRRAALDAVGAYRETPWPEDWDLWLRLDAHGWKMAKVPEALFTWRHGPGRLTFTHPRYALDRLIDARAAYLPARLAAIARGRSLAVWGAGVTGRRLARALEPHGLAARRFVDIDPKKIGRVARGAPIVAPDALDRGRDVALVAVGARGARSLVRAWLVERGWREGDDFLAAA